MLRSSSLFDLVVPLLHQLLETRTNPGTVLQIEHVTVMSMHSYRIGQCIGDTDGPSFSKPQNSLASL